MKFILSHNLFTVKHKFHLLLLSILIIFSVLFVGNILQQIHYEPSVIQTAQGEYLEYESLEIRDNAFVQEFVNDELSVRRRISLSLFDFYFPPNSIIDYINNNKRFEVLISAHCNEVIAPLQLPGYGYLHLLCLF